MEGLVPASKVKRFAAGNIDLIAMPIILGVVVGLVLLAAPEVVRSIVLVVVNVIWLVFRDAVFSVGRKGFLRKPLNIAVLAISVIVFIAVVIANPATLAALFLLVPYWVFLVFLVLNEKGGDLKIVSLTGEKVTWLQALIRNIFLIVPFALVPGYICEITRLLINTSLLWRRIVYALCAIVAVGVLISVISAGLLAILGAVLALATAVVFIVSDKEAVASGRLADIWAKTQVVEA
ncbi:MAG: hypothetical protein A2351_00680 [Omnitrophica bacterium RIFOXYB12_FULL_50_7]|nr:MAG: hypothetical protein A2351_00680 [Omnitrophica bacterium RIFOXYB12_FULL_50_7]